MTGPVLRPGSLPERIWRALRECGPSYAAALASKLDAQDAAVTQALTSLKRRGLVAVDRRDGRRVLFRAIDVDPAATDGRVGAPAWPGYTLDDDIALLRAAHATAELEALMLGNRSVGL